MNLENGHWKIHIDYFVIISQFGDLALFHLQKKIWNKSILLNALKMINLKVNL